MTWRGVFLSQANSRSIKGFVTDATVIAWSVFTIFLHVKITLRVDSIEHKFTQVTGTFFRVVTRSLAAVAARLFRRPEGEGCKAALFALEVGRKTFAPSGDARLSYACKRRYPVTVFEYKQFHM